MQRASALPDRGASTVCLDHNFPQPVLVARVINLVRRHAPGAAIAFNTNPTNSVDAALRWLP